MQCSGATGAAGHDQTQGEHFGRDPEQKAAAVHVRSALMPWQRSTARSPARQRDSGDKDLNSSRSHRADDSSLGSNRAHRNGCARAPTQGHDDRCETRRFEEAIAVIQGASAAPCAPSASLSPCAPRRRLRDPSRHSPRACAGVWADCERSRTQLDDARRQATEAAQRAQKAEHQLTVLKRDSADQIAALQKHVDSLRDENQLCVCSAQLLHCSTNT
eukprot:SAG31_NODE_1770_length_7309_cov_56.975867_3_plen_217_part_00